MVENIFFNIPIFVVFWLKIIMEFIKIKQKVIKIAQFDGIISCEIYF
jgi:hypothetical protein